MIPRLKPQLDWRELAAALRPPRSDDVARFERAFAREMGQRHAVAFPYGRTGLALLLEAMGLRNAEVICPAYTCVVVPHAIVVSGNEPVFVDSSEADFNMDLDLAEAAISPRTGALVATSIFGYPVDLEKLEAIRSRHPALRVIQDCAHSFAAEWRGRAVQRAGDAAIFGLNISKLITSIFGGMVTTDDEVLAARLRDLRRQRVRAPSLAKSVRRLLYILAVYPTFWGPAYGLVNRLERRGLLDRFVKYYDDAAIDMPADYLEGLTAVEARVGIAQLRKYRGIVARRRSIAEFYGERLATLEWLQLPPRIEGATYSHYVPRVKDRGAVMTQALEAGVQLGEIIEYSVPEMAAYRGRAGASRPCPVAGQMARSTINLPVCGGLAGASRTVAALTGRRP